MLDRLGAAEQIIEMWGPATGKQIVTQYNDLKRSDMLLRDLAGFCFVGACADPREISLERAEGRREVFLRMMSLIESDPLRIAQFLEGERLD